ncbi:MAG TPA: LCP family protein [Clostridiaceae bacterium]|nr:LCP family protein [Clostridiaceae bacterium]
MNLRRFYFTMTSILSIFLFAIGSIMLGYISTLSETDFDFPGIGDKKNVFGELLSPFTVTKEPVNFVLVASDKWSGNTDTIMLVNVNPNTSEISIMSIPRDTKVNVSGLSIPKINAIYASKGGPAKLVSTLSDMLDINIKYYVHVNIKTVREIIDLLGGVEIDVPPGMDYDDPLQGLHIHLKPGRRRLNGEEAEQFLRFRQANSMSKNKELLKYYDGSDLKRIEMQQYFVKELIKQKANILYLPKINDIVNTVYENLDTNITMNEVTKLIKSLTSFKPDKVKFFTLPGKPVNQDYSYFIYDKDEALEITREYFKSSATGNSYENVNKDSSKSSGSKSSSSSNGSKKSSSSSTSKNAKEDFTKNNPSNNQSSVKGTGKPMP